MVVKSMISPLVTLLLLGGVTVHKLSYPTARDAKPYHDAVRMAVKAAPWTIGQWVGSDEEVPPAALALLKPNVVLSRRYENQESGEVVTLLLVQCRDARDMAGHYPPVCYKAHGWTERWQKPVNWVVGGRVINGMTYEYYQSFPTYSSTVVVANAILLPNGQIVHDMVQLRKLSGNYLQHFFGAAQLQIVFVGSGDAGERKQVCETFLSAIDSAIKIIGSGVSDADAEEGSVEVSAITPNSEAMSC